jgi:hypothetical protein
MKHKVTLLEGEDYDLEDDIAPEYDLAAMRRDTERERRFRAQAAGRVVRLAPDVADAFSTAEAVNEALRRVLRESRDAA